MCLVINKKFHKSWLFSRPKPLVAKTNIPVFKILLPIRNLYITPFQRARVFFDADGVAEGKKTALGLQHRRFEGESWWEVNEGYHSYTNSIDGKAALVDTPSGSIFNAVIPKGSLYYIGENGDVVSDQLVILSHQYNGEGYDFYNYSK